jgi:hypothetical protein
MSVFHFHTSEAQFFAERYIASCKNLSPMRWARLAVLFREAVSRRW